MNSVPAAGATTDIRTVLIAVQLRVVRPDQVKHGDMRRGCNKAQS